MLVTNPLQINHKELHILGSAAKGKVHKIYLHWTAGHYGQAYSDYHFNIDADGQVYQTCKELTDYKPHTYLRNRDSIAIALCCGYGAVCFEHGAISYGDEPPTPAQIDKMAQVVAVLADALELGIEFTNVMTHAEAAFMDGYGPGSGDKDMRWDLWYLPDLPMTRAMRPGGVVLRGKAIWYREHYMQLYKARLMQQEA